MKFLCDVHISFKIISHLNSLGFETIHVNQILDKWFTKDHDICKYADANNLIIITKDYDFRNSYFINKTPKKLIKINLGNVSNQELITELNSNIKSIQTLDFKSRFMIEIDQDNITVII